MQHSWFSFPISLSFCYSTREMLSFTALTALSLQASTYQLNSNTVSSYSRARLKNLLHIFNPCHSNFHGSPPQIDFLDHTKPYAHFRFPFKTLLLRSPHVLVHKGFLVLAFPSFSVLNT